MHIMTEGRRLNLRHAKPSMHQGINVSNCWHAQVFHDQCHLSAGYGWYGKARHLLQLDRRTAGVQMRAM